MSDRPEVTIMMSTYNGGDSIIRQVDSIFGQRDVDVHLYIRDDGSESDTVKILERLEREHAGHITVRYGRHTGWKQSFMELLYSVPDSAEYYGFSDQDDVWLADKLISAIRLMEQDTRDGAKLAHCNALSVDDALSPVRKQEDRAALPPSYKAAIATEYFRGCAMVWNRPAMEMIRAYRPRNRMLAHDYWAGLICTLFGKIYYSEEYRFWHVRHSGSASEDGDRGKGRAKRLKLLLGGKRPYMNPCSDLLGGYKTYLSDEEKGFILSVIRYRTSVRDRIRILTDRDFRRPTFSSTLLFRLAILLNLY